MTGNMNFFSALLRVEKFVDHPLESVVGIGSVYVNIAIERDF